MSHYISRDDGKIAAWEILNGMGISQKHNDKIVAEVEAVFDDIPAADVAPVRHGRWQITDSYPHNVYCSECHQKFAQTHWAVWEDGSLPRRFCPNCGAKMEEGV